MGGMNFEATMLAGLKRIRRMVFRLCRTADLTDDVLQETAASAVAGAARFDGRNIDAWLYTIAYRIFINMKRKRSREVEDVDGLIAGAVTVPGAQQAAVELGEVLTVLGRMPVDMLDVLLRDADGQRQIDIAVDLGLPIGTVKSRLYRARRFIGAPPCRPRGNTCRGETIPAEAAE